MKYFPPILFLIASAQCVYLPPAAPVCVLPITTGLHHGPNGPTVVQSNDHHSWTQAHQAASSNAAATAAATTFWFHNNHPAWSAATLSPPPPPPSASFQNHAPDHHRPSAMYVAATPGAVHKAPLPGHSVNQQALNLAPAPGTGY